MAASILTSDPWTDRDLTLPDVSTLTRRASKLAYEKAGIGPEDLDLIELHDCFATAELLHYENLGICGEGEAGRMSDEGATSVGGKIQVHMGPHGIPNSELYYLGTPKNAATDQSGVIDHLAFGATEPEAFTRRLEKMGVGYRPRYLPESQLYQLFLRDPNGLTIELNFFGITDAPGWGGEDYSKMPRVEQVS